MYKIDFTKKTKKDLAKLKKNEPYPFSSKNNEDFSQRILQFKNWTKDLKIMTFLSTHKKTPEGIVPNGVFCIKQ